jgi:hypothetical protein
MTLPVVAIRNDVEFFSFLLIKNYKKRLVKHEPFKEL